LVERFEISIVEIRHFVKYDGIGKKRNIFLKFVLHPLQRSLLLNEATFQQDPRCMQTADDTRELLNYRLVNRLLYVPEGKAIENGNGPRWRDSPNQTAEG
jgi:hypothetical protein